MKTCKIEGCDSTDLATRSAMCRTHHREYTRQHYQQNKKAYIDRAAASKKALYEEICKLKAVPCAECGQSYPVYVMDFDHLDGSDKVDNISSLVFSGRRKAAMEEISKCEVVCANCHRGRTHRRKFQGQREAGRDFSEILDSDFDDVLGI